MFGMVRQERHPPDRTRHGAGVLHRENLEDPASVHESPQPDDQVVPGRSEDIPHRHNLPQKFGNLSLDLAGRCMCYYQDPQLPGELGAHKLQLRAEEPQLQQHHSDLGAQREPPGSQVGSCGEGEEED